MQNSMTDILLSHRFVISQENRAVATRFIHDTLAALVMVARDPDRASHETSLVPFIDGFFPARESKDVLIDRSGRFDPTFIVK